MIEKIEINGKGYKIEEPFKKYVIKRLGKLDRYLPRRAKKDVSAKVVVTEIGKGKTEKYEIDYNLENVVPHHLYDIANCKEMSFTDIFPFKRYAFAESSFSFAIYSPIGSPTSLENTRER